MVSIAKVSQALDDITFPTNKQALIRHAQERDAPDDIIEVLHRIPDQPYYTMSEVWDAIGEVE